MAFASKHSTGLDNISIVAEAVIEASGAYDFESCEDLFAEKWEAWADSCRGVDKENMEFELNLHPALVIIFSRTNLNAVAW